MHRYTGPFCSIAMAEPVLPSNPKTQGKKPTDKRPRGRPRKNVEDMNEAVVTIEGATTSLGRVGNAWQLGEPVCTLQIPNHLLREWHRSVRQGDRTYVSHLNDSIVGHAVQVVEGRRLEGTLSRRAGAVQLAFAAATGRARYRVKNGVVNVVVFGEDVQNVAEIVHEVEMLHGQVIDVKAELEGREAEVQSMKEEIQQFLEDRNGQGLANVGRPIDQVGERHQRRKLKQFRCNAQKALWFAESFGLSTVFILILCMKL